MKGIIEKVLVVLGFCFLIGGAVKSCKDCSKVEENPSQKMIDSLQNANKILIFKNDSLLKVNQDIDLENEQYRLSIETKTKEYEKLKKQKDEKIDNIINLPLDSAILFFSRELSKEDNN